MQIEIRVIRKGYKCERCSHQWMPRANKPVSLPFACPKCKSPYWNTPRINKRVK